MENRLPITMQIVKETLINYIETEMSVGGILEDVETFRRSYQSDEALNAPLIWLKKHPTIPDDSANGGKNHNLNNMLYLVMPCEFVCVDYDQDPELAETKSENLATRVGETIRKHFNKLAADENYPVKVFNTMRFYALYTTDQVNILGKSQKTPASNLVVEFVFRIDWSACNRITI